MADSRQYEKGYREGTKDITKSIVNYLDTEESYKNMPSHYKEINSRFAEIMEEIWRIRREHKYILEKIDDGSMEFIRRKIERFELK